MLRLILVAALFVPALAWAQQPQPTNSQAEIAAFLARNLSTMAGENDALHAQLADAKATAETAATAAKAQIADLQKQLADAKATESQKP